MKKMFVMAVAAALCGVALAGGTTTGYAYFSNYAGIDPTPSKESGEAYYSCYLINSDTVSSAAGLETWLTDNGGITRENIAAKSSAALLSNKDYTNLAWDGIDQYSLEMKKDMTALTDKSEYKYAVIIAATSKTSEAPDFAYEIMQGDKSGNTWSFDDSEGTPVTWTTAPVPEPTSGILLLLGVAGLALKRKRA